MPEEITNDTYAGGRSRSKSTGIMSSMEPSILVQREVKSVDLGTGITTIRVFNPAGQQVGQAETRPVNDGEREKLRVRKWLVDYEALPADDPLVKMMEFMEIYPLGKPE
jgi:hypothetical protein